MEFQMKTHSKTNLFIFIPSGSLLDVEFFLAAWYHHPYFFMSETLTTLVSIPFAFS